MAGRSPLFLQLLIAAVAGAAAGAWLFRGGGARSSEHGGPAVATTAGEPEARLEEIERQLAALEGELALRKRQPVGPSEDVAQRLESIERELAAMREADARAGDRAPETADALAGRRQADVDALRAQVLDPRATSSDRIAAAGALWSIDLSSGTTGARTPAVVDVLVELARTEPDPELRRLACYRALDATRPEHVPTLLEILGHDESSDVRKQAADTLQHHLEDPTVRTALERARVDDPSTEVRDWAVEILSRREP